MSKEAQGPPDRCGHEFEGTALRGVANAGFEG